MRDWLAGVVESEGRRMVYVWVGIDCASLVFGDSLSSLVVFVLICLF